MSDLKNRLYILSWIEDGKEYTEEWTFDGIQSESSNDEVLNKIALLKDGETLLTGYEEPAYFKVEATGRYYVEEEDDSWEIQRQELAREAWGRGGQQAYDDFMGISFHRDWEYDDRDW